MPQATRKGKSFDVSAAQRLHQQGQSYRRIAKLLGSNYSAIQRALNATHAPVEPTPTGNGNLPAIPSQPIAVVSQPIAAVSQPLAIAVDDLQSRVAMLEAFMAAVQAEHRSVSPSIATPSHRIAVHRRDPPIWVSRGLQVAADMVTAMDDYAAQHRLEKREVLDAALRQFFAQAGEAVGDA